MLCFHIKCRIVRFVFLLDATKRNYIFHTHTHTHTYIYRQKNKALCDSWAMHLAERTEYGFVGISQADQAGLDKALKGKKFV